MEKSGGGGLQVLSTWIKARTRIRDAANEPDIEGETGERKAAARWKFNGERLKGNATVQQLSSGAAGARSRRPT